MCPMNLFLCLIPLIQISYSCFHLILLFIFMHHTSFDKFTPIDRLGEGSFGVVYKAIDTSNQQFVALKKILLPNEEEGIPSSALREISILKEVKHPNIVSLKDVLHSSNNLILVFEFVEYDMKKYLSKFKEKTINQKTIQILSYQLLKGIQHLHQKKILHRDLKPQNLLVSNQLLLKIADFGLARTFGIPSKSFTPQVVTLWYRPPELLLGCQNYSSSIDMWSVACIIAEMANLRPLFPGKQEQDQLNKIFEIMGTPTHERWEGVEELLNGSKFRISKFDGCDLGSIIKNLDEAGLDLLKKMLELNPEKRIRASEALEHKFFDDIPPEILQLYQ